MSATPSPTEVRFLALLNRAYDGWLAKIEADFSQGSYETELANLESDDVYTQFGLAVPEYALIRLMGRMSISIGRRLGELYDNLPKFVAAARFGLDPSDVSRKVGNLNLDVCVPYSKLQTADLASVRACVQSTFGAQEDSLRGLGIEIRYNFNPNDSARLRKDDAMAQGLIEQGLLPIYLVYSGISPRDEAIARLRRAGWTFLIGSEAAEFTKGLLGLDLTELLGDEAVRGVVAAKVDEMMLALYGSHAFAAAVRSVDERRSR